MARGAESKAKLIEKLKEIYPDAFEYGKEFRIPFEEDGQRVEIKVALTCAKSNVGGEGASEVSGVESNTPVDVVPAAPTEEEKANIAALMDRLGL
jgi:hypothetical protein